VIGADVVHLQSNERLEVGRVRPPYRPLDKVEIRLLLLDNYAHVAAADCQAQMNHVVAPHTSTPRALPIPRAK